MKEQIKILEEVIEDLNEETDNKRVALAIEALERVVKHLRKQVDDGR
jgi:hypothetical protein